jgi:transposase-like protein
MDRRKLGFLGSKLIDLKLRKRQRRNSVVCPMCHGNHIELIRHSDEGGRLRREEYLCHDCDCEWDWTFKRPFFQWRPRIRAPRWLKIDG